MRPVRLDDLTVVVPTRNEEGNIRPFLDSVPPSVGLIVVDSSQDGTPELIEAIRPANTLVVRAKANIPEARQLGAELAHTNWLLFTDADVIFPPEYFENLAGLAIGPAVGGIVGAKSTVDGFDRYHRWFLRGQRFLNAFGVPSATGSNMLVTRSALASVGGFDEQLTVNEDTELMFRITKAGYDVSFVPGLAVLATDHRRLEAGCARKMIHGALRNTALWFGFFGPQIRNSDWGYWKSRPTAGAGR